MRLFCGDYHIIEQQIWWNRARVRMVSSNMYMNFWVLNFFRVYEHTYRCYVVFLLTTKNINIFDILNFIYIDNYEKIKPIEWKTHKEKISNKICFFSASIKLKFLGFTHLRLSSETSSDQWGRFKEPSVFRNPTSSKLQAQTYIDIHK